MHLWAHVCMQACTRSMYTQHCTCACMRVFMHVCLNVCMHVGMYECMNACMRVRMYVHACMQDGCMDALIHECKWMHECMHECIRACRYVCTYVSTSVCTHVCTFYTYIYICIHMRACIFLYTCKCIAQTQIFRRPTKPDSCTSTDAAFCFVLREGGRGGLTSLPCSILDNEI